MSRFDPFFPLNKTALAASGGVSPVAAGEPPAAGGAQPPAFTKDRKEI